MEDGTIVLIGATTENPSFHLNNALLSRCKLVVLSKLSSDSIEQILKNAVERLGGFCMESTTGIETEPDDLNKKFVLKEILYNKSIFESSHRDLIPKYLSVEGYLPGNCLFV